MVTDVEEGVWVHVIYETRKRQMGSTGMVDVVCCKMWPDEGCKSTQ